MEVRVQFRTAAYKTLRYLTVLHTKNVGHIFAFQVSDMMHNKYVCFIWNF